MKVPCDKCLVFTMCRNWIIKYAGEKLSTEADVLYNNEHFIHEIDFIYIVSILLPRKCPLVMEYYRNNKVIEAVKQMKDVYKIAFHKETN